ncbi:uncharacterized protein A4U43_C02F14810 [Asparagus officinalis]|uniref:Uncharacterized protein n=1 Tax=Asparagus officinalis TaxID=4686 RepID=A0A5P1FIC3_ASPOF|nr:uncharacterized protein A4U43_C02F14810 [Asparagus officinalis]
MTSDATGEWSSLVGAARAGSLSSPRLHVIEQVNSLVVVVMPTRAEEEVLAHEKTPSQKEEEQYLEETMAKETRLSIEVERATAIGKEVAEEH